MKSRKYILTGGTGFLGSLLGVELLKSGHSVFFLGRGEGSDAHKSRQEDILLKIDADVPLHKAHFFKVDFEKLELGLNKMEQEYLKDADGFFHLAADLSFKPEHGTRVRKTNHENLLHVMSLSKKLEIRFFFVSTAYVHGSQSKNAHIPGAIFPRPFSFHNAYEESKYDAEIFIKDWSSKHNLKYTILRPSIIVDREGRTSTPFGFSSFLIGIEKLKHKFPRLMSGKFTPLLLPFPYSPCARLNLVPADWVVHSIITIAEKNKQDGQIFNLVNPEPIPIKKIIVHAFEKGSGIRLFSFPAPDWFIQLFTFTIHLIGKIFKPLRILSERLWLFRFYVTETILYARENTDRLLGETTNPVPTLSDNELYLVTKHFISHYNKKTRDINS